MITLSDIAKRCGVTKQTVSQILRNPTHPAYQPGTRARVLRAARELHYVPNRMARSLNRGRTKTLSLIFAWNIADLVDEAERSAEALGYGFMIQFTSNPTVEAELRSVRAALEWRVDGIIWMPSWAGSRYGTLFNEIRRMGTRVVFLEGPIPDFPDAPSVEFDYAGGYRAAIEHAVERGYRRLVYVTPWPLDSTQACPDRWIQLWRQRWTSLRRVASRYPVKADTAAGASQAEADAIVATHLGGTGGPACFLCETAGQALHVVDAVRRRGMRVPEHAGIVTTGDFRTEGEHWLGELVHPTLTALVRPFGSMGRQAVEALVNPDAGKAGTARALRKVIPTTLVCRESTARCGQTAPASVRR